MSRFDDRVERLVNNRVGELRDEVYSILKDSDPRPNTGIVPTDLSVVLNLLRSNNEILNEVREHLPLEQEPQEQSEDTEDTTSGEEKEWRKKVDESFSQLMDDVGQLTDPNNSSSAFNIDNWKRMIQELEEENPNGARATDNIRRMHDFVRGFSSGGIMGGLTSLAAGEVKRWLGRNWEKCFGAMKDFILTAQLIGLGGKVSDIKDGISRLEQSSNLTDGYIKMIGSQNEKIIDAITEANQCCAANTQILENVIYPELLKKSDIPNKEILATKPDIGVLSAKVDDLIRRLR